MPKKTSAVHKREWLKAYEEGRPEASIAKQARCDVRTVKKGIDDARRDRDATLARADLLKEALRKHNDVLVSLVERALEVFLPLPYNQPVPWQEQPPVGSLPILGNASAEYEMWPDPKISNVTLVVEAQPEWQLVQEHLKHDPFSKALGKWKKAVAAHLEARIAMQQKLAVLLQTETGYEISDADGDSPVLHPYSVGYLSQQMLECLIGSADLGELEAELTVDSTRGQVTRHNVPLLLRAQGKEESCREAIIQALRQLGTSAEAQQVVTSFRAAEAATAKARHAAEEIRMLGLLPGQCHICRRLGM